MNIHHTIKKARVDTPFGPYLFGMQLPEDIFQKILKLANDIWERKDHISWNHELVGHMKYQYYAPHSQLKEYGLYDFLFQCFYWYLINSSKEIENKKEKLIIELEAFWINYQEEGEYNPVHNHGQATMSGAIHIKEPEYERSEDRRSEKDGTLQIISHSPIFYGLDNHVLGLNPTPRGMYIWPAPLLHLVNPFKGKGQRVSMAYNVVHYFADNPDNKHRAKEY